MTEASFIILDVGPSETGGYGLTSRDDDGGVDWMCFTYILYSDGPRRGAARPR